MFKPLMPIPSVATVSCLIDEETRSWIPETVHAFFDPQIAEQILSILISRHGGDFVRWAHRKNGLYTVRSAYNLART
jgi:hypothetical protein